MMRAAMIDGRRDGGFTLLEMVVVLAIVGLVVGLALTRGPLHSNRLDVQAITHNLIDTLRLAQSRAIAENRPVAVALSSHGYRLQGTGGFALPPGLTLGGATAVRFAPDGSASGGLVVLRGATSRVGIEVDWLTGRAHVVERH